MEGVFIVKRVRACENPYTGRGGGGQMHVLDMVIKKHVERHPNF